MAEMVGGAFLSSFLQVAFDRLASRQVVDFFRGRKLDEKLPQKLRMVLRSINPVIADAELKQFRDSDVKAWLDDVRDAVLDAEDLLDEIDIQTTQSKLESESETTSSQEWWTFFNPSFSLFEEEVESSLKEVIYKLECLKNQKDDLGLKRASGASLLRTVPSTSRPLGNDKVIHGRDVDKDIISNWLTSPTNNGDKLSIISIVGMGGLGKTTLAQHVFNDPSVKAKFDVHAWVHVSDDFDVLKLTKAILETISKYHTELLHLELIQGKLEENLSGKKFLLVLDDVWNNEPSKWEAVQTPLNCGAPGCKIIVTTRSREVAKSCMRSDKIHDLKELQEDHCWNVFVKHASNNENSQLNVEFEKIGRQIVAKCKGLPLALKTMGSLLYTKSTVSEWESVLRSEIWQFPEQHDRIIPALLLSYHHLSSPLKKCFGFFALFRKGFKFDREDLILFWMAQDCLQDFQQNKGMEEVGKEYFDDLLSRSFFQQSSEYAECYVMHDLINDLAKYISGDFCFRFEDKAQSVPRKTRHLLFASSCIPNGEWFKGLYEADRLRTVLSLASWSGAWMSNASVHHLFSKFRFLRVLSLCEKDWLDKLPDSVGNLKHLRSLDLSFTFIEKLPDSICFLFSLQILKLEQCRSLNELPVNLHKLTKLHHLDLRGTGLRKLPIHLGKLKNLHVLLTGSFCMGKGSDFSIQHLRGLSLYGNLHISDMQNIVNPSDAAVANMKSKMHLVKLELQWSKNHDDSEKEKEVLEKLRPSKHLGELRINSYGGTEFPHWFGDDSLSSLVSLKLKDCENCILLPSLGLLPSLKKLSIIGLHQIVAIGGEFYGSSSSSFASLETLVFKNMKEWEEWDCKTVTCVFTCLRELFILNCPKLKEHLPEQLPCLRKLRISDCPQLVGSLPRAEYNPSTSKTPEIKESSIFDPSPGFGGIYNSPNLNFSIHHCQNSVVNLSISNSCDSLTTFPLHFFPNLLSLDLKSCPNLKMISQEHSHNHLRDLTIRDCPQFESFSGGEGLSAPRLERFRMRKLENLRSLAKQMHTLLPSLTQLSIVDCPEVELISGEGLPSNLTELNLLNCSKLMASLKGALGANISLQSLRISGMGVESFQDEGLLPLSLTSLTISDCPHLTKLDCKGLRHLSSLRFLYISKIGVESFPDEGLLPLSLYQLRIDNCRHLKKLDYRGLCHPSSLTRLRLSSCPNIQCLPEEGLPKSISTLEIYRCPFLKQRCQEPNGEDWGKIAYIQDLHVKDEWF